MAEQYSLVQSKGWLDGLDISSSLREKTQSIGQSVSHLTNQTINPIKSTVSDIQSGIALIKDTDRQFLNQLHTYRSETINTINDYLSSLTGGHFNFDDFGSVVSYKDGFKVNSSELTRLASNAIGFNISSIDTIKNDLSNEFLSELNEMSLGLSNGLFQNENGKITISGDWDKQIGDSVFAFLTNSSSDFHTVRNFAAANAVLNVMVYKNADIGFVEGFAAFKDLYLYESDYHAALINCIETLLRKGDINSLDEVLKILDQESIMSVNVIYPKFAETVLSTFSLPETALIEEQTTYGEKLITIIEKVNGDSWMMSKTFYGSILNIGLVTKVSDDSKTVVEAYTQTLLKTADQVESSSTSQATQLRAKANTLLVLMNAAGLIAIQDARTLFTTDFPNAVTF